MYQSMSVLCIISGCYLTAAAVIFANTPSEEIAVPSGESSILLLVLHIYSVFTRQHYYDVVALLGGYNIIPGTPEIIYGNGTTPCIHTWYLVCTEYVRESGSRK